MIPWWSTEFGATEIARVTTAIEGRHISQGKITREFEDALAERLGVPYVVCTTSGTTALTMALLAVEVGAGDEVIVPDKTWIATAHSVMITGAKVALSDTVEDLPLLPESCMVNDDTAAVVPVNLNGRIARPEPRFTSTIPVIEDSCQAFPHPPRGDIACYSLSTAKIIATGQGGFCATRSESLYRELLALRTHDVANAMVPEVLTWRRFGYNFRFTDIQAAIGLAQLERLDARIAHLRELNGIYKRNLPAQFLPPPHAETEIPLYNEIILPTLADQETLRGWLTMHEIEARPFYPLLHTAPYLNQPGPFPNAERFAYGLVLPSGPTQPPANAHLVCHRIWDYLEYR